MGNERWEMKDGRCKMRSERWKEEEGGHQLRKVILYHA
jgi:hypothetical protein